MTRRVRADWLLMLGLLRIGPALTAGVALRLAAFAGSVMTALMWVAEWGSRRRAAPAGGPAPRTRATRPGSPGTAAPSEGVRVSLPLYSIEHRAAASGVYGKVRSALSGTR
ncbi:hypothetical protein GTY44_21095 [Streptomyces sp. SID5914]|nr:hypothetical protein [Streptomyces sp. SID5914]